MRTPGSVGRKQFCEITSMAKTKGNQMSDELQELTAINWLSQEIYNAKTLEEAQDALTAFLRVRRKRKEEQEKATEIK